MSESAEPTEVEKQEQHQQQEVEKEQPEEKLHVPEKVNEAVDVQVVEGVEVLEDIQETRNQEMVQQHQRDDDDMEQEQVRDLEPDMAREINKEFERDESNDQKLMLQQKDEQENSEEEEKPLEESHNDMPLLVENLSQGAIEDEEMPSMVTISSLSRIDESETNIRQEEDKKFVDTEGNSKSSPKKQEDDDSDSVCVIDDDTNEEDEGEDDRESSYEDEDGSSSYPDDESEEIERQHYNANYYRTGPRGNNRTEDEDDNDEEEEEEEGEEEGDEEDDPESPRVIAMNDYSDPDGFEYGSDDLVHRHSNGFTKHQQERSNSLQDLSLINCERPQRRSMNPFSQKAIFQRNQERRPSSQGKFSHVESKVKQYIQNMSEQRRISGEIRKKSKEEARNKQQEMAEIQICRNEDVVLTCRTMKDYTEKTLKEAVDCYEKNSEYFVPHSVGNGDTMIQEQMDDQMDVDPVDVETHKNEEKLDKMNGAAFSENQNNFIPERKGMHRREEYTPKTVSNGEDAGNIVCDLRTLSYEEYMKGSDKEINEEVIPEESVSEEIQEISESCNNKTETDCGFQIQSVVSNYRSTETEDDDMYNRKTPTMMIDKFTETEYQEDPVINQLRLELHQRNMQFDNLRDAYQKTISENLGMKMELENLRKMVAHYQQQKPPLETKVIAVQTEAPLVAPHMPIIDDDNSESQVNPRLTTTSLMSAVSSQWSDSTGSAAISMEPPPNVTTALNSDESTNQQPKTPKVRNPLSRAFMTSQRILQTLSNITHGKSKSDKVSRKRSRTPARETLNEPGTSAQSDIVESSEAGPPNSKKRKADDNDEHSSTAQPFKIPHTEKSRRASETSEPPVINLEDSNLNADDEDLAGDGDVYVKNFDDDVKVFVYPENEAGREHSFLIQAKEVTNNPKPGVRECGPYLLGNVEVYMTEMNGTINIWGKELSQASTSQNNEEIDTSTRSKDLRPGFRWQSTPRIFNNQGSLSTSKKSKVTPRFTHNHQQHSCYMNNTIVDCDSCNGHNHRLSWPSCNHSAHENQHSCCPPTVRIEEAPCGCHHKEERRNNCCGVPKFDDGRRFSMPNVYHQSKSPCCYNSHHSHCRNSPQIEMHRHQPFVRRHSFNPTDDDEEEFAEEENAHLSPNFGHSANETSAHSCSSKLVPPDSCTKKGTGDDCSESPSCQNENDPLIFQKQTSEVIEGRKRRLSGRKVRGLLLDLLKGCGDCRTSNPINKTALRHNASVYQPSTSTQQRACSPNQQSCSPRANEKCSSCRHRNDKTTEIEAQLEFFREEMEKLRSRSDVLRDMLDTLRNEEIIN